MKNLTPEHMRCGVAQCPGVYELADGRLLIVGERSIALDGSVGDLVGPDEAAIIIDRALLSEVLREKSDGLSWIRNIEVEYIKGDPNQPVFSEAEIPYNEVFGPSKCECALCRDDKPVT